MTYPIVAEGLVKRFGNTVALDGADLAVTTGSVLGLPGPKASVSRPAVTTRPLSSASRISSARSRAPRTSAPATSRRTQHGCLRTVDSARLL
ncbi:MAG: hypothetical protein ACRDPO_25870 [Streptosporangiaceae bacterium]